MSAPRPGRRRGARTTPAPRLRRAGRRRRRRGSRRSRQRPAPRCAPRSRGRSPRSRGMSQLPRSHVRGEGTPGRTRAGRAPEGRSGSASVYPAMGGPCSPDRWSADREFGSVVSKWARPSPRSHHPGCSSRPRHDAAEPLHRPRQARLPLLLAVARRGLPNLAESTLVPAILFFVVLTTVSAGFAMGAVLVWAYAAILRRVVRGRGSRRFCSWRRSD